MSEIQYTDAERRWLRGRWQLLQRAQEKADKASAAWNAQNDAFKVWFIRMGISDPVQQEKVKGVNLELKGQLSTWDFHQRDANRYASEIQTFKMMKEMGAL